MSEAQDTLELKDLLLACMEKEDHRDTCATVISVSTGEITGDSLADLNTVSKFMDARLEFQMVNDILQADFIFRTKNDFNLERFYHLIEKYFETTKTDTDSCAHVLEITLLPLSLKGSYQVSMINPLSFFLCADAPKEDAKRIKLFFDVEDILIAELSGLDFQKIVADAKRVQDMEAFYIQEEEKKKNREIYETEIGKNKSDQLADKIAEIYRPDRKTHIDIEEDEKDE